MHRKDNLRQLIWDLFIVKSKIIDQKDFFLDLLLVHIPDRNSTPYHLGVGAIYSYVQSLDMSGDIIDLMLFQRDNQDIDQDTDLWFQLSLLTPQSLPDNIVFNQIITKLIDRIDILRPRLLGFSVVGRNLFQVIYAVGEIKRVRPSIKIILGGLGSEFKDYLLYEKVFIKNKLLQADFIVNGQAENVIKDLLSLNTIYDVEDYKKIGGLYYRIESVWEKASGHLLLPDFKELPIIDLAPIHNHPHYFEFSESYYTVLSRGCVYRCSYCNAFKYFDQYDYYDIEKVLSFFQQFKYSKKIIFFYDATLNININWLKKLVLKKMNRGLDFPWGGWFRIQKNIIKFDILHLLVQSGLTRIDFGMETASPKVLQHMNKYTSSEDLDFLFLTLEKLKAEVNCNLHVCLNIIVGYPTETEDDFEMTISFCQRFKNLLKRISLNAFYMDVDLPLYTKLQNNKDRLIFKSKLNWTTTSCSTKDRLVRYQKYINIFDELGIEHLDTSYEEMKMVKDPLTREDAINCMAYDVHPKV